MNTAIKPITPEREQELVAQLIQHILQMLLQGFTFEMLLDGILPSPVDP